MGIKIAMFGRAEIITRAIKIIENKQNITILPFRYEEEIEVLELIKKAFICDIYIFTDPISYLYVKERMEKKRLPVVQVALDEHTILSSVYHLMQHYPHISNRLSIDTNEEDNILSMLQELNINSKHTYQYSYQKETIVDFDAIFDHHVSLWTEGKINHVLTSSIMVEKKLHSLGIPVSMMQIPSKNIEQAIIKAVSVITFNKTTSNQIIIGYAALKDSIQAIHEKDIVISEMGKIREAFARFAKKTNATVFDTNNHVAIVGTKSLLDNLTRHYRDFPLLHELNIELQLPFNIGFGLGLSPEQAEENALLSLKACNLEEKSISYIMNEREELIGPIGVKKHVDTSKLYQALIHKARLNNELSYNFIDFITKRNNEPFSSNDIAVYYNVTKRSAERTVNKLLSGEVIRVSGEERPYVKGRPRKLFTLNQ
ncbi:hypothetical protein [Oceanobacillus chungangensis]|uniref:Transcriptional regulator n=1 Tax=Oceanobacillus chungangensis TaxID=1229152 RepID=A0A3D8PWE2_9BACI|nr:hypothetical protein [Oceanobacillus chungangensis]RDW20446.1 hypothetical protein CWR45_04200 [Oceanobacillus chungangensis]